MQSKRVYLGALALAVMVCLIAAPALAQNPTGSMTGRVTADDEALPGVTVKISSDALPGGSNVTVTGGGGEYLFRFLPAGTYSVTFALDGFHTLDTEVKISVSQKRRLDAEMQAATVAEEIVVTGAYETVTTDSQGSVTFEQSLIEELPVPRNLQSITLMAPGTAANAGSGGAVNIAGQPGPQTLFMANGVVLNDTVWGSAYDVYIEDAIEETTVSVSGITAEYGRFTGGVINMVTKSGGNEFSGSFRTSLTNESWESETPLTTDQEDKINPTYEATFGGYIMKDHLWFFLAGRSLERSDTAQYYNNVSYPTGRDQQRYEAKLTVAPHISHRVLGTYMKVDDTQLGSARLLPVEPTSVIDRQLPQEMMAINYTGVITESFFLEAQYSEREFQFKNSGGTAAADDRINGTFMYMWQIGGSAGSHLFCSSCPGGDENRNNEDLLLKGSLFMSGSKGSHDLVFGYDKFNDIHISNNYQSPSNYVIWNYSPVEYDNGIFYPQFVGGEDIDFWPILLTSNGTDFVTDSIFVNDTWRLNTNWTFNLGVRYDKNNAVDGIGNKITDDSRISPRLGVSWDVRGDGEWIVNASFGRYTAALDANKGGASGGGSPSYLGYTYGGPTINVDENGNFMPQYTTPEALAIVFDWFDSVGGLSNTDLWYASPSLSGINLQIPSLVSPYTDEISVGFLKRLGNKGLFRADYVYREGGDFYVDRTTLETGTVTWTGEIVPGVEITETFDLTERGNDNNIYNRTYHGLLLQGQYRVSDRLTIGGNYTLSNLSGNFNGENSSNGISVGGALNQPEYLREEWSYPAGDLAQDQTHTVSAYLVWDIVSSRRHNLSFSWLEKYSSGQPYGAVGSVLVGHPAYPEGFWFPNPGYLSQPTWANYYFTDRDAFHTDALHRTDLSFNYSFYIPVGGTQLEIYLQPEVINVFNESGVFDPNTSVQTWRNSAMSLFDPFASTPEQGTHWDYGSNFGEPDTDADFQTPRTFRFSVGFRF